MNYESMEYFAKRQDSVFFPKFTEKKYAILASDYERNFYL